MKENKNKNKDRKEHGGDGCYSESMRAKCFCFAFKLRFLHLIYRVSLILKSNLELALSNYFIPERIILVKASWGGL